MSDFVCGCHVCLGQLYTMRGLLSDILGLVRKHPFANLNQEGISNRTQNTVSNKYV